MRDGPLDDWSAYARDFGIRLHRARIAARLTQEELAYTAGITRSHYQQLEKGLSRPGVAANPSLRTVLSLARVLRITPEELLPPPDERGNNAVR